MSWSTSGLVKRDDPGLSLLEPGNLSPEMKQQYDAAVIATHSLIASGALGDFPEFQVSLSGHGNPGHKPTPGWTNDCISISVSQYYKG